MKRLALLILVITLPILTYFQYQKYRRFHPPHQYDYPVSDSVDGHYHNPLVLQQYYQNAYEIGRFARQQWRQQGVDVRYPDDDPEAEAASQYYTQLVSTTHRLEKQLIASRKLKQRGFDNAAVAQMEAQGWSPLAYRWQQQKPLVGLKKGDEGSRVWTLQQLLVKHGHNIPVDGIFNQVTEQAVKELQQKAQQYPSGVVDQDLLRTLVKP